MTNSFSHRPISRGIRYSGVLFALLAAGLLCPPARITAPAYGQQNSLPAPRGWVDDQAGAFDQQNRENLFALCVELERKTTAEMAVLTIDSLHGEPIESYATRLFNYWGVGKRGYNNGVLLVFSMQDRRMRIAVGDGLRSVLPDSLCQRIINDTIVPFFKAGRYGDGAYAGAARVAEALSAHYGASLQTLHIHRPPRPNPLTALVGAIARFFRGLGCIIVLPIYLVLRLLFGRTAWWQSMEQSSGGGSGLRLGRRWRIRRRFQRWWRG